MMSQRIIDGEIMEGGGQILRNCIALSCLLKEPIIVKNIRGKRSKPGLRPQHLTGIDLVCETCNGTLSGAVPGSTTITFHPGELKGGRYIADTQTAGSVCLLIQVALPCLMFAPERSLLSLKGGTNAEMAPPIDFFEEVFIPIANRFGMKLNCNIIRRGFYPKGGGEVKIEVEPIKELTPVQMTDFGKVIRVRGKAYVAGVLPIKVANTMARTATKMLNDALPEVPIDIEACQIPRNQAVGTGCGILIVGETSTGCLLSGSGLGKKGLPAEQVGTGAAEMLLRSISNEACVDEYLQDQMILLMALASGKSAIQCGPITLHTETAIHIAETLAAATFTTRQLKARGKDQGTFLIECNGIGFKR
eukprot:Seg2366.4 transcript_id=Seg2366.4/GoldUCD/mRNA.D3Y31 product="RNA 3'-terminal phosphate cyclase" protein_id=Seg2366.4/GoldUCD/D3Y31